MQLLRQKDEFKHISFSVHDHNTRGGTNIRVKRYNLSIGQRTFAYRGAKVWDNIPEHIKNVTTVECFKTMFLKHVSKEVYECEQFKIDGPAWICM